MVALDQGDKIARIREGRLPNAVYPSRIPADMIDMDMGADNQIDGLRRSTMFAKAIEKTCILSPVPFWTMPRLFFADAGIDDNGQAIHFDNEALNRKPDDTARKIQMRWFQPALLSSKRSEIQFWKQKVDTRLELLLEDRDNSAIANLEHLCTTDSERGSCRIS